MCFSSLPQAILDNYSGTVDAFVPQQTFTDSTGGQPHSVIEGEFFERGEQRGRSFAQCTSQFAILVFHNASDQKPDELAAAEDKNWLQGADKDRIGYFREIQPADRKYIIDHARGNGDPEPPPIDHQGINDEDVRQGFGCLLLVSREMANVIWRRLVRERQASRSYFSRMNSFDLV